MNLKEKLRNPYIITSQLLFVLSLTQKCYCTTSTCADSIMVLLLGWFAVFSGGAGLVWLANPLLIASWLTFKTKLKWSMWFSVGATLISLWFLLFDSIHASETGQHQQIVSYKAGYWLWVLSNVTMLVGTFAGMLKENNKNSGLR
ncbi:MAG TPA: hypothetical protein PKN75_03360 [Bacteroidia bacterium]|nr:hypothetical protein [Bacteroidia bacterium]